MQETKLKLLERIVDRRQDSLYRFAYIRTGSQADAEDIVQDVLHDVFRIGLRSRADIGEAVKGILSPIDDPLEEFQFRFLHILSVLTTRLFIRRTRCEKDLTEA